MLSQIRFNVGQSDFVPLIQQSLAERLDSLSSGIAQAVSLAAPLDGYSGEFVIAIEKNDTAQFAVDARFPDQSRFPARLRAAATALRNLGQVGEFQIAHSKGDLTVQKLFEWELLQSKYHAEQTYLARRDGRIVCCTLQPEDNPGAPYVIMVGDKPRNMEVGALLCGQKEPFPVFLKQKVNRWAAQGEFRYASNTTDAEELKKASQEVNRPVTRIIYLTPVDSSPEESTLAFDPALDVLSVVEGGRRLVSHFKRERNREIVALKKAKVLRDTGTLACECCGFDFVSTYGAVGKGYCEAHHRVPLAEVEDTTETKLADLAIVCANCHRMLHRGPEFLPVETLRAVVDRHKAR